MRQIVITKKGGPQVLKVLEVADLLPSSGEVRISVKASGLNFADIMTRMGVYPDAPPYPCVMGYEVSGIIDKISSGIDPSWLGKEVLAITKYKGQAEQVIVPIDQVFEKPPTMSFEQAAAFPVNYLTAYLILSAMGSLQSHETVLIHNVGGGVGLAALEISNHIGAETFGTASQRKHEFLKKKGLKYAIDYRNQNWKDELMKLTNGRGVDLVLDPIGGKNLKQSYQSVSSTGRVGLFGLSVVTEPGLGGTFQKLKMLFQTPIFHPFQFLLSNKGVFGVNMARLWHEKKKVRIWADILLSGQKEGWINPHVDKVFKFDQVGEAHQYIESRQNIGKVILVP
ncbi:zinc-binding dehydrogenase [Leptospira sarikeiensis]|uniref:Alcohol dehydrogenase n=1 Tax=Leptospira sarikeiensis TaxID=2484943 RepID=A0A4R9K593_9LEPT|nr:zinc-binding dehydrogenase [Leptospira sarikeiensis]TGL61379.1 alcohol dehydrogenase [Leptospira sarikeiensis]